MASWSASMAFVQQPAKSESFPMYRFRVPIWYKQVPQKGLPMAYAKEDLRGFYRTSKHTYDLSHTRFTAIMDALIDQGRLHTYIGGASRTNYLSNTAYSRLVDKLSKGPTESLSGNAELGVGLVESPKTANFIYEKGRVPFKAFDGQAAAEYVERRSRLVARYTVALKQGRERSAERFRSELMHRSPIKTRKTLYYANYASAVLRQRWMVPRWLSARWLEYWLCVAPTIGDMQSVLAVLSRDQVYGNIRGKAVTTIPYTYVDGPNYLNSAWRASVMYGVDLRIDNPNKILAQQLGLLNPLVVAGELVPFSFVTAWFVNWRQVLGAWTDFSGYTLSNHYRTYHLSGVGTQYFHLNGKPCHYDMDGFAIRRWVGGGVIDAPKLQFRLPPRLSLSRAATSMSLVVSTLLG